MNKSFIIALSKLYPFLVSFSIFPLLYFSSLALNLNNLYEMLFWIFLTIAAEYKSNHQTYKQRTNPITLSFTAHLSGIIILGVPKAVIISIISVIVVGVLMKKSLNKILFNLGQYSLTVFLTGNVYFFFKYSEANVILDALVDLPALFVAASVYILINTLLITMLIYLTSMDKFLDIFFSDFGIVLGYFYSLVPMSIAVTYIYNPKYPYVVFIMIPPLLLMEQAVKRYYKLHSESKATLAVLAEIIDQRDKYTYDHSARVSKYAREIAEELNLSYNEIVKIEAAGLVHDLGKVTIADNIIKKKDKLTEEEFFIIKKHPEMSHRLLKNIQPYEKAAEYVLYHHERFDGRGYPNNLVGTAIPLGARILTVADSYDAMTSDRSYRKSLSQDFAVKELIKNSGTQFDPNIVETFIKVLKTHYNYLE